MNSIEKAAQMRKFWEGVAEQLRQLRTAATASDVLRILAHEGGSEAGFFAGSGGDDTVYDALTDAGWRIVWMEADFYYAMQAPDGSAITYIEGDIRQGTKR
jgi:hypothetical protein